MGQIWREKCQIPENDKRKKLQICANHFSDSDVGKKKFKTGAVPIFPNNDIIEQNMTSDLVEPENISYSTSVAWFCRNCESYAKSADFYRKKYNRLLEQFKILKNKEQNKKLSLANIINGITRANNINKEVKTFCNLLLSPRPKEYSQDVKDLVQNLFYASQSSYLFMRKNLHLNLPHISTVIRWAPVKSLQPGLENTALPFIKLKCSELSQKEKDNMILLIDEMGIKRELRYNQKLDLIDGFEDDGFNRKNRMAKHLCCFMLKSMFTSYGVILNCFTAKNGLPGEVLKELIIKNLDLVKTFGLRVKLITCDQGSNIRKCYKLLVVTEETPFFRHDSDKVFCIFDFPHLLKSLRNGWMTCDLETLDGVVSFQVVKELWESENSSTTKMCPKITRQHICEFHRQIAQL